MARNEGITVGAALAHIAVLEEGIAGLLRAYSESTGLTVQRVEIRPATVGLNHPLLHEYEVVAVVQLRRNETYDR